MRETLLINEYKSTNELKMEFIETLDQFRGNYQEIRKALPWLDSCVVEKDKPAFPEFAKPVSTDFVNSMELDLSLIGNLLNLKRNNVCILRYNPDKGPLNSFGMIFPEMVENNMPLAVLHTDVGFDELTSFANKNIHLKIIIESGPRKLLYFLDKIMEVLVNSNNVFLCTYNFCNWLGLEQLCKGGFSDRIIYGSHMPAFNSDVSMGPIILSKLDWRIKCDIAGNNLRKLLGKKSECPVEIEYIPPKPFIIDSHAHNLQPGIVSVYPMPTPDLGFDPFDWINFIDLCGIDQLYLMPGEALFDSKISCRENVQELTKYNPKRFFYYEVFNPNGDVEHIKKLRQSLHDPKCIGIKIHPVVHKTNADDEKYRFVYEIANKNRKPLMSHSWEISDYNPGQYRSHPDRFRKYLNDFRELTFVFGHAGGRPSTFDSIVQAVNEFKNVYVDLAGDYYDNGLIEALSDSIGPEKILFASDVDWIDPRCNLAAVIGSDIELNDMLKILRFNALKIFDHI